MTPEITYEMLDYVISLREGIMDAWDGAIVAMKSSGKSKFVMFLHTLVNFLKIMLTWDSTTIGAVRSINF